MLLTIRNLAEKLTAFNQFKDFVIIELEFRRGNFEPTAQIIKNSLSRAILRASSPDAEVLVKMIRPRRDFELPIKKFSAENIWRVFTESEISDFVKAVGDKNKIHPPIVPAFLILESICAEFNADFIKLKFKNFITAGEKLSLQISENEFKICADVIKILGEMS